MDKYSKEIVTGTAQDTAMGVIEEFGKNPAPLYNQATKWLSTGATVSSGTFTASSGAYAISGVAGAASRNMPIIGFALDYSQQVHGGENSTDAMNKAILHTGVGIVVGTVVASFGAPVILGIVAGALVTSAINEKVDTIYDSNKKGK